MQIPSSHPPLLSRRQFLAGAATVAFSGLPHELFASPSFVNIKDTFKIVREPGRPQRGVIIFWLQGGPSHTDMFDLKTECDKEYKSPFKPIGTTDIKLPELMPRTAEIINDLLLVRNMETDQDAHGHAVSQSLTGNPLLKEDKQDERFNKPARNSAITDLVRQKYGETNFYTLDANPERRPFGAMQKNEGFYVECDLRKAPDYIDSELQGDAILEQLMKFYTGDFGYQCPTPVIIKEEEERLKDRLKLRSIVDQQFKVKNDVLDKHEAKYNQGLAIIDLKAVRKAFNLGSVPPNLRDLAGRNPLGNATIIACNLIQAGIPLVVISHGYWDTHGNKRTTNEDYLKVLLPQFDNAFSYAHKVLGDTNIFAGGEFGRTPKINQYGGRDHHKRVYTVAFTGPDVKPGVIGATDKKGEDVTSGDKFNAIKLGPTLVRLTGHRMINNRTGETLETLPIFKNERK